MPKVPSPWFWKTRDLWCVEIDKKRYTLAKGKAAKAEAHEAFHRLMVSLGMRDRAGQAYRPTVAELFEEFLESVQVGVGRGERAAITYEGYVRFLSLASARFGKTLAEDLTPHQVHGWCDQATLEWGPTTRANAITAVKAAFRWGKRRGLIPTNPIADMEKPTRKRREAVLTEDQIDAVLADTAGTPFADLIAALRESGCRPSEVTTLTADRVDLANGVWLVINKTRRKTGQEFRPVYLNPALIEMSRRLIAKHPEGLIFRNAQGNQWTRNAQACAWGRLRKRLGLGAEATSYAVRHRYAMEGLRVGLDASEIAALMGHTDASMVNKVYGHWDKQGGRLRQAARKVRPDAPASPSAASGDDAPADRGEETPTPDT